MVCTAYRQDGRELAVAMLNATILFFDPSEGRQLGSIEGRVDLDVAQISTDDLVTPHRAAKERCVAIGTLLKRSNRRNLILSLENQA